MDYDVLILGSGPGGYVAAIRAGQYGLKVGCIEKDPKLGGTCLHVGCVPTKAYLHWAELYDNFRESEKFGISHGELKIDMGKMREEKQKIVDKHAGGIGMLFKKNKVEHIAGYGKLLGGGKIEVDGPKGKKTLTAKNIIIASGSRARMLPGLEPDAEQDSHQHRDSREHDSAQVAGRDRRRGGRHGVRLGLRQLRRQVHRV